LTFADAQNEGTPLPDNYENVSANQIIFVRVENAEGCFSISEVTLDTVLIHETVANALEICDDPEKINDQTAYFDLTSMTMDVENALGGTGYSLTYHTSIEEAQSGLNPIQDPTHFQNTTNPQTVYVRASDSGNGCAGTVEFAVEVLPVPEFNLPDYIAFCDDDEKTFEFEGDYSSYTWFDADGNEISNSAFVEFPQEGTYTLEVRDNTINDCPARREVEVIFDHNPTITDIKIDGNTVTVLANGGYGPYEYSYNNGLSWHDYYILDDVPSGIFDMIVKSKYGCISAPKTFGVLGIPNVITPNGDGYNDYWEIRALEMYPEAYIKIFDRYGKIFVDREIGPDFKWDGTYQGRPLPSSDYWYIITIKDKSISGHLTIRNRD
jgi:gliding motility-associated-like protein